MAHVVGNEVFHLKVMGCSDAREMIYHIDRRPEAKTQVICHSPCVDALTNISAVTLGDGLTLRLRPTRERGGQPNVIVFARARDLQQNAQNALAFTIDERRVLVTRSAELDGEV